MREVSFSYNVITAWNAPAKSSRRSIIHLALINYVGASSPATLPYSSFSTTLYPFHYPSSSPSIAEAAFQWQSCNQLRLTTRTTFYAHPWPDRRPITRDETHTVLCSRPHSAAFLPCPVSSCALRCTLVSRAASVCYLHCIRWWKPKCASIFVALTESWEIRAFTGGGTVKIASFCDFV